MQVASIVPVPYLELVREKQYHLCLAHLAMQCQEYKQFYKERAAEGKFVILDNGAAEGQTVSSRQLVDLAIEIGASELILPDYIGDDKKTLDESYRFLHYVKEREDYKGRIMAVPQAQYFNDWVVCAKEMLDWPIDTIGVPKFLTYQLGPYARLNAVYYLREYTSIDVHLLGCAYDPREPYTIDWLIDVIRGVDSSMPYLYARDGYNMWVAVREGVPRSQGAIDFFDSKTSMSLIASNIQIWERMCKGELM